MARPIACFYCVRGRGAIRTVLRMGRLLTLVMLIACDDANLRSVDECIPEVGTCKCGICIDDFGCNTTPELDPCLCLGECGGSGGDGGSGGEAGAGGQGGAGGMAGSCAPGPDCKIPCETDADCEDFCFVPGGTESGGICRWGAYGNERTDSMHYPPTCEPGCPEDECFWWVQSNDQLAPGCIPCTNLDSGNCPIRCRTDEHCSDGSKCVLLGDLGYCSDLGQD